MEFYQLWIEGSTHYYRDLDNALRMGELILREMFPDDAEQEEVINYCGTAGKHTRMAARLCILPRK